MQKTSIKLDVAFLASRASYLGILFYALVLLPAADAPVVVVVVVLCEKC